MNDGTEGYICPQSVSGYVKTYVAGLGNLSDSIPHVTSGQAESEDCLFLDVISPQLVFAEGQKAGGTLAPVLVNIHGGGLFRGDKTTIYNPTGLLRRGDNNFVFVSMNYRLAALGFLSGVSPSATNYTSPNAGLLDQRFALKWVQKNIHLFGGDSNQVTLIGESAGASSILRHLVAYGGSKTEENDLFIRGIAQSPAMTLVDPSLASLGANLFLNLAGVSSVDEARNLSSEILQQANQGAQASTPFNKQYFNPTIDNDLIPDLPSRLLNEGLFIKNISMIASYNYNEGRSFGNQSVTTNADFNDWVYVNFPSATSQVQNYIINNVYPPIYDGSLPYTSPLERIELFTLEYLVSCNTYSISRAYGNNTHNYLFNIPPGIHAQDLAYTWYPTGATPDFYANRAIELQGLLAQFVLTGDPNRDTYPVWDPYTEKANILKMSPEGFTQETDVGAANHRCEYLLSAPYFPQIDYSRVDTNCPECS